VESLLGRRKHALRLGPALVVVGVLVYLSIGVSGSTGATPPSRFTATPLTPSGDPIDGSKSRVGRIAQTDPDLLDRTDSTPVNVMVKLDYDSVATYDGGIQGLPATSPHATGKELHENRPAVQAYEAHIAKVENAIVDRINSAVSGATIRGSSHVAYGGVAMEVPANQINKLVAVDGVVAVQKDELMAPDTSVTPEFTGAKAVWPSLGGPRRAGQGVIVGVLDTGIWPEHPSFADPGINNPGGTFRCEFGDGSDPQLGAPFKCNDKLIGAYAFTNTYLSVAPALPGENCNNTTKKCSARDADGHGTHTTSTAAGGPVGSATVLGVNRGRISGMAPGAHIITYRVCLALGCFQSDSVAAVNQAILDGVNVINFSIGGGSSAYTDPVELAFLDAYEAGILVNASAGNAGPGAGTAGHAGPWVNTVAASTSNRHFLSTLNLSATSGPGSLHLSLEGVTITKGTSTKPVVRAESIPGPHGALCLTPLPVGSAVGKIVTCQRGVNGRVEKGYNALQGGAAAMILYNPTSQGLFSDNHWLPTIMLEGPPTALLDFLNTRTGVTGSWETGAPKPVRGDVMTNFSSRGPVGDFVKPDVTAPGIQILAGHTPDPYDGNIAVGPPGELFQAIAGTSMSSPHSAGIAALVKAAHHEWTPGQIKSALMTSSLQDVLKDDGVTPSDPFDRGAGSIRANRAVAPTVTFDVTAAEYIASATDPLNRVHLNLPSINADPMPGILKTTRTFENVSGIQQTLETSAVAPPGATIEVSPSNITVNPGQKGTITITINGTNLANGQYFGEVRLSSLQGHEYPDAVLPVAFRKAQGNVTLTHSCTPTTIKVGTSSKCEVQARNLSPTPAESSLTVEGPPLGHLDIQNVSPPGVPLGAGKNGFSWSGTLSPALAPKIDSLVTPGNSPAGYLPLSAFGVPPISGVGDETIVNFNVPAFKYGSETYTRIGITSNGYAVVGGGTSLDLDFNPQTFPDPTRPNNVLAPYWTDLNPGAGGALRIATLTDGVDTWLVLDWEAVPVFTGNAPRSLQIWLQLGATEGIWFTFGATGPGDPAGLNIGAENRDGSSGKNLGSIPAANSDLKVNTLPPTPGGMVTITYDAAGKAVGLFDILASLTTNVTTGVTTQQVSVTVTP
jgi:subtilisin family serine protease